MKNRKKFGIGFLTLLMMLLLAGLALGAYPLTDPADGGTITGGNYFVNGTAGLGGVEDCALTITNVGSNTNVTANTVLVANHTNTTVRRDLFNFTINTFALEDNNRYNLTVTCSNFSSGIQSLNWSDEIIVNNFKPELPTALTTTKQTATSFTLSSTVAGANTTSCSISWEGTSAVSGTPTATHTGNTCSFALTGANDGSYGYYVTATDGTDSIRSAVAYFTVDANKGGNIGVGISPAEPGKVKDTVLEQFQKSSFLSRGLSNVKNSFLNGLQNLWSLITDFLKGLF